MHPRTIVLRLVVPVLILVAGAVAMAARAAPQPAELTVDEVRTAFIEAGFVASLPIVNEQEDVISFSVVSANGTQPTWGQPTLRVFVFPSVTAAQAAHHAAQTREEGNRGVTLTYSDDRGPQLLSGYGLSTWRKNVALIQVASLDDTGAYPNQIDCDTDQNAVYPMPRTIVTSIYLAPVERVFAARAQAN